MVFHCMVRKDFRCIRTQEEVPVEDHTYVLHRSTRTVLLTFKSTYIYVYSTQLKVKPASRISMNVKEVDTTIMKSEVHRMTRHDICS